MIVALLYMQVRTRHFMELTMSANMTRGKIVQDRWWNQSIMRSGSPQKRLWHITRSPILGRAFPFQALKKGLIPRNQDMTLLETQQYTGAMMDPACLWPSPVPGPSRKRRKRLFCQRPRTMPKSTMTPPALPPTQRNRSGTATSSSGTGLTSWQAHRAELAATLRRPSGPRGRNSIPTSKHVSPLRRSRVRY